MDYVFVKEGFCWPALFVPALWLLFRRMWLVLLGYVVLAVLLIAAGRNGVPLVALTLLLLRLGLAIEGNELRRWTLERRGFRLVDVSEGEDLSDAELRFFLSRQLTATAPPPPLQPLAPPPARIGEGGEVVGLFPAPGGGT
jgi:hypothetical protein